MSTAEEYLEKAIDLEHEGKFEEAIIYYSKVLELEPNDEFSYTGRAYCYQKIKKYAKAIEDYSKVIELDPEEQIHYIDKADCYETMGEYNKAINYYSKSMELGPEQVYSYNSRANCYKELGDIKSAIDDYKHAIELFQKLNISNDDYEMCKMNLAELKEQMSVPIKLSECTEKELETLENFDKERIEQFFKARNEGIMWYDIEKFAEYFNLQPHEIVQIQDRLIFPLKNSAKHGRKIDF